MKWEERVGLIDAKPRDALGLDVNWRELNGVVHVCPGWPVHHANTGYARSWEVDLPPWREAAPEELLELRLLGYIVPATSDMEL